MADNTSKLGAVLTWAGGIAATVIAGVLLYYFTGQKSQQQQPPPQQPAQFVAVAPPPPPQVGLDGFVLDVVSQKPIVDAIVTADLGNKLASQPTDNEGRYAFIMDSTTPPAQSISIDVLAGGYVHYTNTVAIAPTGITFAGVQLQPNAPPAAASLPGHFIAPNQIPPKPPLILHIPKNYAMRADTATLKSKQP
jgi:hypothetical protein